MSDEEDADRSRRAAAERTRRDEASRNVLMGSVICLLGIVVTVGSYSSASAGGSYVVAWGAIIFGGVRLFRGLGNR